MLFPYSLIKNTIVKHITKQNLCSAKRAVYIFQKNVFNALKALVLYL